MISPTEAIATGTIAGALLVDFDRKASLIDAVRLMSDDGVVIPVIEIETCNRTITITISEGPYEGRADRIDADMADRTRGAPRRSNEDAQGDQRSDQGNASAQSSRGFGAPPSADDTYTPTDADTE